MRVAFLILFVLITSSVAKKQRDYFDLSMGSIEIGIAEKPHFQFTCMEIGFPLTENEKLFLSAPMGSFTISPILSADSKHISLNAIPSLIAGAYVLINNDQFDERSRRITAILLSPQIVTNPKLTFYAGRFDFYLRQRTDVHLIDRTKIGVYSESNIGVGCRVFRNWSVGLFGAVPILKTLPYKPQKPYIGARVYLSY